MPLRSPQSTHRPLTLARLGALLGLASLASGASGCKLFRRAHPHGHLARTASPEQYTAEYPDQTSTEWQNRMSLASGSARSFSTRDTGTLHAWMRYGCNSRDGSFSLAGTLGLRVDGQPPIAPVPVTVTAQNVTLQGIPRGASDSIVINAPRAASEGGMETDGYIYLFDIQSPQQGNVTLEGSLQAQPGSRCATLDLEVWRD